MADQPYAEDAALLDLVGTHPKAKILATLLSEGNDVNITMIASRTGMSRSTVYNHIDRLIELDVVKQTVTVAGSPLYEINRQSEVAKKLAQTEWELLDVVAEETAE